MPKIFISYRREDSQYQADRLHAALKQYVVDPKRDIFIDVDNIPVGVDFVEHLESQVAQCDILLAVIGPDWLSVRNTATGVRRLDDPTDFVRIEIAAALLRGIPVAPVLLDGTSFPAENELPHELKPLARRNGIDVRRVSFDADVRRLIHGIGLGTTTEDTPPRSMGSDPRGAVPLPSTVFSSADLNLTARLREFLIATAGRRETMTYDEAVEALRVPMKRLWGLLDLVAKSNRARNEPLLCTLVVGSNGVPGDGYFRHYFPEVVPGTPVAVEKFRNERDRAFAYNWLDLPSSGKTDPVLDAEKFETRAHGRTSNSARTFLASYMPYFVLGITLFVAGGAWAWQTNPGDWRGVDGVRSGQVAQNADTSAEQSAANPAPLTSSVSGAKPGAELGARFTQADGACGDVRAIVYFDFDKADVTTDARGTLEGALRKTFDCVVESVVIEAHEDLGGTAAYAQALSARRADAVAAVLQSAGIEAARVNTIGFGNSRPLQVGVASPLNRRVEVTLALSPPRAASPQPVAPTPRSTPSPSTRPVSSPRAGETFGDCSDCPQMVSIPAGSFMMGSPASEAGRFNMEGPQRRVTVPAFAAGKFEVTWNEYTACVSAGGCAALKADGFGGGTRPVTNVSWNEAVAYTEWLSTKTGQNYRLLSEAEWEYAARAGSSGRWSFGDNEGSLGSYAWSSSNSGSESHPVGAKTANAFGLHDMHGNVWEWVQDCYAGNYSAGQPSNGSAYQGGSCSSRVFRGGSWVENPQDLRSAYRFGIGPSMRSDNLGLRVARTL